MEETFNLTVAFAKSDVLVEGTILSKGEKRQKNVRVRVRVISKVILRPSG